MLFKETVSKEMWELIQKLMKDEMLKNFLLVGGTALSLKIGHRISVDVDLFTTKSFDAGSMVEYLKKNYNAEHSRHNKNSIFTFIDNIKVDLVTHDYPIIKPVEDIDNIRMISNIDIGAMKLHAMIQSGKRIKDFIDMYFLLEQNPLKDYLNAYEQKYAGNSKLAGYALLHHEDIDMAAPIQLIKGKENSWKLIKDRLQKAVVSPDLKFGEIKSNSIHQSIKKGKGFRR